MFNNKGFATEDVLVNLYAYDDCFEFHQIIKNIEIKKGTGIPNNATLKKTLKAKKGFVICFNEASTNWEYVIDNRGLTIYDEKTKEETIVNYLGEIKKGYTFENPPIELVDSKAQILLKEE